MTFDKWLDSIDTDTLEDLDVWSAHQGWNAAMKHLRLDLESLDLLRKMQPLPQHEESK